MTETFTLPKVLPIGTILFELLFLLVAIPIEAYILHLMLKFDKKTSIFYAIAINVLSSVIGWNTFFLVEPILPIQIKTEIINYVFFNDFKTPNAKTFVILTGFIIFFLTFLLKFFLLKLMLYIINHSGETQKVQVVTSRREKFHTSIREKLLNNNLATTTLIANSVSYTAISLILLIRSK
jgi:hypothetical protein